MNGCFTHIHIIYAATVPNLSLVLATLAILVHVLSLHCGHIESSCIMLVSPLPVFTPEGTIGLPSVRPSVSLSVCLSVRLKSGSFDNLKTI